MPVDARFLEAAELPEVRLRQPSFRDIASQAGLLSFASMAQAFDTDIGSLTAALDGETVSPSFVTSVLLAFPDRRFADLFELMMYANTR